MSFAADLAAYADKIGKSLDETCRAVTIELFNSTIMDTPVLNGFLRGAWVLSEGTPDFNNVQIADKDGKLTTAKVEAGVKGAGSNMYLTNSMPYAYRVEFEGWSKDKSPDGMMRRNFARVHNIVARAARRRK